MDFLPVFFFGISIFLVARCLGSLLLFSFMLYREFGFHSSIQEFDLLRFVLLSFLPFGFNMAFGVFFGLKYLALTEDGEGRKRAGKRGPSLVFNPAVMGFLGWWIAFNVPLFLAGDSGKRFLFPSWPPESLYQPIQNDLRMFFFMGNGALPGGFFGVIGWTRLWLRLKGEPGRSR